MHFWGEGSEGGTLQSRKENLESGFSFSFGRFQLCEREKCVGGGEILLWSRNAMKERNIMMEKR